MKRFMLLFLILFNTQGIAEDLIFKLKGKPIEKVSMEKIKSGKLIFKGGSISSTPIKLYNVFRGYYKTYEGYKFFELLTLVYGKEWQQKEKLIFTSKDGYHQIVLIAPLIKLVQNKVGYIAFSELGKNGFTPIVKGGQKIDPGPLYLVWSNFTTKDKASHGDQVKWPYQLTDIEIE